ncbi:MAG TPA: alpha/beta fold hydrolase [Chthonomonadaceae bacterium]|nr:alpha/beta fold hydrolase [Chthonomonadaceae bacterium]
MTAQERWTVAVGEQTTSALVDHSEGDGQVIALGHGASTNMEHRSMESRAAALVAAGLTVVRFNFLYTEQKRSPPERMPRLLECFRAVVAEARERLAPRTLLLGGHSMGGRAASHLAAEGDPCDGLLLLSYPLYPTGQPEKLRSEHLPAIRVPVLSLSGTRDEMCDRERMEAVLAPLHAEWTMHWLEGADHGFHVQKRSGRTDEEVMTEVTAVTREWLSRFGP